MQDIYYRGHRRSVLKSEINWYSRVAIKYNVKNYQMFFANKTSTGGSFSSMLQLNRNKYEISQSFQSFPSNYS